MTYGLATAVAGVVILATGFRRADGIASLIVAVIIRPEQRERRRQG